MKKTLLLLLATLLCGFSFAKPVSLEKARQVAVNFWNQQTTSDLDGLVARCIVKPNFVEVSSDLGLDGMYVFNTVDNRGFVIISADDAAIPVLGYSFSNGILGRTAMPDNIKGWLRHYSEEIAAVAGNIADSETADQWQRLIDNVAPKAAPGAKAVSALIQTQWDQDSPYNNLCPLDGSNRSATGCVATAMKYWGWPTTGTGSHSYTSETLNAACSANFGNTTYDWANMPNGPNTYSWNSTQKTAVATLMYHCGVSVDMDYTWDEGSGASPNAAVSAFTQYFGYASGIHFRMKDYYSGDWTTLLKNELDAGRPMMYGGYDSDYSGGHSFVCDGYNSSNQFHFNWGWSGYGDGFFSLTSLTPSPGGIGGGSYNFSYQQNAITGISSPNGNPDTTGNSQPTTSDLVITEAFTVSSPVSYGSAITGSCGIWNVGSSDFEGRLGVAAYNSSNTLVAMLYQTTSVTLESNYYVVLNINKTASTPLVAGTYTAKAVYSTDGTNWVPITAADDGCATSVTFVITGSGSDPVTGDFSLATCNGFTLNNTSVALGSNLSGTCNIANLGDGTFSGKVGVAAYNSSNSLVYVLALKTVSSLETNQYVPINFNKTISSPFTVGSYTAKAVYSTDNGTSWNVITSGYGSCPTSVSFTVTAGGNAAIDDVEGSVVTVFSQGRNIVINGATGNSVVIVDAMGRIVYNAKASDERISIPVVKNGVYFVKVGSESAKKLLVH